MAAVLMEGFRVIPDGSGHTTLVAAISGSTTWERVASRTGWGIQQRSSSTSDSSNYRATVLITSPAPFSGSDFSMGFATYHLVNSNPGTAFNAMIPSFAGTNNGFGFSAKTGAAVASYSINPNYGAVEIMDTTPTTPGWHWWCITGRMNQSAGGWFRLYRDGNLIMRLEGDTISSTSTFFTSVSLMIPSINSISGVALSDFILNNDSNVIPESRVDVLLPRSTLQAGWTPTSGLNHECIDDEPTVNTADYVSTSTVGATDLYRFDPLPHNPPSIYAVQFQARASKSDTGARTMATVFNGVEGTAMDPGPALTLADVRNTNPATGTAWTKTDVDLVQAGVRLIS